MLKQIKQTIISMSISMPVIILITVLILTTACREKPESKPAAPSSHTEHDGHEHHATTNNELEASKPSLKDVVKRARQWGPVYPSWYGQEAPDFTLTGINGVKHRLSDYRGKKVLLVFWATWCGPCIMEIPHLVAMRNILGEDELVILAISYTGPRNSTEMIKNFVKRDERINYTVIAADIDNMPAPYNTIQAIPSSFFINPDGTIKLATAGLLSLPDIKAILQAEQP